MMRSNAKHLLLLCLLALAQSCSQTLTGPSSTPSIANPQDYIWPPSDLAQGINYSLLRQGAVSLHTLSSADDIHIRDAALNRTAFLLRSFADSVMLDSIGVNSIFSLPVGYSFAGRTDTAAQYLGINAIVALSSGTLLAATDSGIYYYDAGYGKRWIRTFSGSVRVLIRDNSDVVYAAHGDSVLVSYDRGATWPLLVHEHPQIPVSALAWAPSGHLYVGYARQYGVERSVGPALKSYGSVTPVSAVTALAVAEDSLGEEILVADSFSIWSYVSDTVMHGVGLSGVRCLYIDLLGNAYAGTAGRGIFRRKSAGGVWDSLPGSKGETIAAIVGRDTASAYAVTSQGQVVSVIGGTLNPVAQTHPTARSLFVDPQSHILVGTDAGIVTVSNGQAAPDPFGPTTLITVQTPGGLTILDREGMNAPAVTAITPNEPTSSSPWLGGTLLGPGLGSGVTITARVMDHVERLQNIRSAADTTKLSSYGESFIIRYADENPDGSLFQNFPLYWLVYYSRGIGPVLIEEYMLGSDMLYTVDQYSTIERK